MQVSFPLPEQLEGKLQLAREGIGTCHPAEVRRSKVAHGGGPLRAVRGVERLGSKLQADGFGNLVGFEEGQIHTVAAERAR